MAETLPFLICPKTGHRLKRITGQVLKNVNELVKKKKLTNALGESVTGPLTALWVIDDNSIIYPERQNIPILLIGEGFEISGPQDRSIPWKHSHR